MVLTKNLSVLFAASATTGKAAAASKLGVTVVAKDKAMATLTKMAGGK